MIVLLSCAKTMSARAAFSLPEASRPAFAARADALAAELAARTADELGSLLRVNGRLAAENLRRFRRFHDAPALPAVAAYAGTVFRHLAPATFSEADFAYAQRHLRIVSFLYGLLRPLDAIRPYRLEGDVRLTGSDDETLFASWQPLLTETLRDAVRADDGILLNLASAEMRRMFRWKTLQRDVRIITPEFRIRGPEGLRTVVIYTKMCRGEMARRVLQGRIADPAGLRAFEWEGFRYDAARSEGDAWTFLQSEP